MVRSLVSSSSSARWSLTLCVIRASLLLNSVSCGRLFPATEHLVRNGLDADAVGDLREHERPCASHPPRITLHHLEVGTDKMRQVGLVDHEQIRLRDAWTALARNLVAARDIDDIDRVISEVATELRGEIIASAFHEQQV